jgi:hypothetical protein
MLLLRGEKEVDNMEFVITVGVIVIAITCLSIEGKLRKTSEQNKEIIELLKQGNEK